MAVTEILIGGTDYADRALFSTCKFTSQVNGYPGECYIRLRDPDRSIEIPVGTQIVLKVDGEVVWRGFLMMWERVFVFPAINVDAFGETRFFDIKGPDINVLFSKRIIFNQADPEIVEGKLYPAGTADNTIIADVISDYIDLSSDTIDTSTFVDNVGDSVVGQEGRAWSAGDTWGQTMQSIASLPAAIYYLRPTAAGSDLVYCDVDTPSAPYPMSDVAGETGLTVAATDDFERFVGSGWGTGGIGTWAGTGSSSVSSGHGILTTSGGGASQAVPWPDGAGTATTVRYRTAFTWPSVLTQARLQVYLYNEPDFDQYVYVDMSPSGDVEVAWFGPSGDDFISDATGFPVVADEPWWIDIYWDGVTVQAKAWPQSEGEPSYQVSLGSVPFSPSELPATPSVFVFILSDATARTWFFDDATFEVVVPTPAVSYREMSILQDGTALVNDQLAWGIGYGDNVPVFVRDTDDDSQALHGLWQAGKVIYGVHSQATINRNAASIVDGSPQSKRGHKNDAVSVTLSTYQAGFLPSQKVDFTSEVWGFNDVIPIRKMTVTYESPDQPKFELVLSHEIDTPMNLIDNFFFDFSFPPLEPHWPPPWPPFPGPTGCSDAVCGITDDFGRVVPVGLGIATCGISWDITAQTGSSTLSVDGSAALIHAVDTGTGAAVSAVVGVAPLGLRVPIDETAIHTMRFQLPNYDSGWDSTFIWSPLGGSGFPSNAIFIRENSSWITWTLLSPGTAIPTGFWNDSTTYTWTIFRVGGSTRATISDGVNSYSQDTAADPTDAKCSFAVNIEGGSTNPDILILEIDVPEITRCTMNVFDDFERAVSGTGTWGTSSSGIAWNDEGPGTGVKSVASGLAGIEQTGNAPASGLTGQNQIAGDAWLGDFSMTTSFLVDDVPAAGWNGANWTTVITGPSNNQGVAMVVRDPSLSNTDSLIWYSTGQTTVRVAHAWTIGDQYNLRWEKAGSVHRVRIWDEGTAEPSTWDLEITGATVFTPTAFHIRQTDNTRTLIGDPLANLNIYWGRIDFFYTGKPCYCAPSGITDDFERTESGTWGTATCGGTYTSVAVGAGGTISVDGDAGLIVLDDEADPRGMNLLDPFGVVLFERPVDATVKTLRFQIPDWDPVDILDSLLLRWNVFQSTLSLGPYIGIANAGSFSDMSCGSIGGGGSTPIPHAFWEPTSTYTWTQYVTPTGMTQEITDGTDTYTNDNSFDPTVARCQFFADVGYSGPAITRTVRVLDIDIPEIRGCHGTGPAPAIETLSASPNGYGCEDATRTSPSVYQLTNQMAAGTSKVFINGLRQRRGTLLDYTEDPPNGEIIFVGPEFPEEDDVVRVCYYSAGPL